MGELAHLAQELRAANSVTRAEEGTTETVKIEIRNGEYDALSSEVVSILGRYDVSVTKVEGGWNYYAVA
jgi:hypothetical protein